MLLCKVVASFLISVDGKDSFAWLILSYDVQPFYSDRFWCFGSY